MNTGKYPRTKAWKEQRSELSKKFWKDVDRSEQIRKMSNGWTQEMRDRKGAQVKQMFIDRPDVKAKLIKRMKKHNPMFNKQTVAKATAHFRTGVYKT